MKHLLSVLLLILPHLVFAQYNSVIGRFTVDQQKGCASLTVTVIATANIPGADCTTACSIYWGDGVIENNQTDGANHTYTQPGVYNLRVLYQGLAQPFDSIQITVTPNLQPEYEVYTCSGNSVQVRVTDSSYDNYFINFGDGTEVQVPQGASAFAQHTYLASGLQTIQVRGKDDNAADNCNNNSRSITAQLTSPPAPVIDLLTVVNDEQIELNYTNNTNTLYRLQIARDTENPGSFQQLQNLVDVTSTTIIDLRTDDFYYCFRMGAVDPCSNTTNFSNIICSANLDAVGQNNRNRLTWTTGTTGIVDFGINRTTNTQPDGEIASTGSLAYNDDDVVCKSDYCYQITSRYTNGSQSISLLKCVTAFSNDVPAAVGDVTSVVGNGVDFTWLQDPAFQPVEYTILKKSGSGAFGTIGTSTVQSFIDAAYLTEDNSCYRINYIDFCDNQSADGIEVCPVRLSYTLSNENIVTLTWSNYDGWQNGVAAYRVEKYDEQGQLLSSIDVNTQTQYIDSEIDPDNQIYRYRIFAIANDGGLNESISNEILVEKQPNIFYPKAFTPDGQGPEDNEVFLVFGQYISSFEMKIFNRWGELMFTTNDIQAGWDGMFRGKPQPEGTYVFTATMVDFSGRTFSRSGAVMLLRKK